MITFIALMRLAIFVRFTFSLVDGGCRGLRLFSCGSSRWRSGNGLGGTNAEFGHAGHLSKSTTAERLLVVVASHRAAFVIRLTEDSCAGWLWGAIGGLFISARC